MRRKHEFEKTKAQPDGRKGKIVSDPNGMYTGRPEDPYEKPVQDADDL